MTTYRLAVIGFGTVGQGLVQLLRDKEERLAQEFGVRFEVVAISDVEKGRRYDPSGIDPAVLLDAVADGGSLAEIEAPHCGWDARRTIAEAEADVVVEASYTDLSTGEPARTYVHDALTEGRHVVTSNKGPIALHFSSLANVAARHDAQLGVEGTVMSGTPALGLGRRLLAGASVDRIQGLLNGTTNYILTRMGEGVPYDAALDEAQARGYAEADPSGDVEGLDAAGKLVILAHLVMDTSLPVEEVERESIAGLTPQHLADARDAEERWKFVAELERGDEGVSASVRPLRLLLDHPLAGVDGATNAVTYSTDVLGDVTLVGPGAGQRETGFALLTDLLALHRAS